MKTKIIGLIMIVMLVSVAMSVSSDALSVNTGLNVSKRLAWITSYADNDHIATAGPLLDEITSIEILDASLLEARKIQRCLNTDSSLGLFSIIHVKDIDLKIQYKIDVDEWNGNYTIAYFTDLFDDYETSFSAEDVEYENTAHTLIMDDFTGWLLVIDSEGLGTDGKLCPDFFCLVGDFESIQILE